MNEEFNEIIAEQTKKAFDLGWNTALLTAAQAIENMKVLGDTASSFAIFVREFQRGQDEKEI